MVLETPPTPYQLNFPPSFRLGALTLEIDRSGLAAVNVSNRRHVTLPPSLKLSIERAHY